MHITNAIIVPRWLRFWLEREAQKFLLSGNRSRIDFRTPAGEPALSSPNSVAWQVFKNPVTLFIGGITAVLLELAEPRVRSGVWDHTSFRDDPVPRLQRTGFAAMVTIYGPRSQAKAMIGRVRRMHERVYGVTPDGVPYQANDPELLDWVQATSAYGFLQAYRAFAAPVSAAEVARYYDGGYAAGRLYGAENVPRSEAELLALFAHMEPMLEPSPIIHDFLDIMCRAPVLPRGIRSFQALMVAAGIEILPDWARDRLDLDEKWKLRSWERRLVAAAARMSNRTLLEGTPPVEACRRLGLPMDYLYRTQAVVAA